MRTNPRTSVTFNGFPALPDYKERTRHSYDVTAEAYQANTVKLSPGVKTKDFLSWLSPGNKILDLGCGPGRDAKFFVEQGYRVEGIDISQHMIDLAKSEVPGGTFSVGDLEDLHFPKESFDAVWASASLLHVPKAAFSGTLQAIYSLLATGGIFYISMKKGAGEELKADERYGGVEKFWNYVDEEELARLLYEQGFHILEQRTLEKSTDYQTNPWISVICQKWAKP